MIGDQIDDLVSTVRDEYVGRRRVTYSRIEAVLVDGLSALFDMDDLAAPVTGHTLPPLWHWVAVANWFPASKTGEDGHRVLGDFLPDLGMPRRMFAGGTVEFLLSLNVGDEVHREDVILSVDAKPGRQGPFVLVAVQSSLFTSKGHLALREVQHLAYRHGPGPAKASTEVQLVHSVVPNALIRETTGWRFATDPTKLMRFSSLTSNSHRIHYDWPYATQVEQYPDLVVQGPFMAVALAEVLRRVPDAPAPKRLSHRGIRPLFCGEVAEIVVAQAPGLVELSVNTSAGVHSTLTAWL